MTIVRFLYFLLIESWLLLAHDTQGSDQQDLNEVVFAYSQGYFAVAFLKIYQEQLPSFIPSLESFLFYFKSMVADE